MKNLLQHPGLVWVFCDVLLFIVGLLKVCSSSLSWGGNKGDRSQDSVPGGGISPRPRNLGQVLSQIGGDMLLVPFCPRLAPHLSLPRSTRRSWRTWRTLSISLTSATPSSCIVAGHRTRMMTPRSWGSSRCDGLSFYLYPGTRAAGWKVLLLSGVTPNDCFWVGLQ